VERSNISSDLGLELGSVSFRFGIDIGIGIGIPAIPPATLMKIIYYAMPFN